MTKAFLCGIVLALALSTCAFSPAFAISRTDAECVSKQGDIDANVVLTLQAKFPQDDHYFFSGGDMEEISGALMELRGGTAVLPLNITELWVSSGPSGDGSTVFAYFQDDCYVDGFTLTQEEFNKAMKLAFPDGYEPYYKGVKPSVFREFPV